jgi:hypothetical protein
MGENFINLEKLRVATPCPIGWDSMSGDEHVRFCSHCQLNVYNISSLTRSEAEQLLAKSAGNICGRLYRRADGTVITRDCPIGIRALRQRASRIAAAVIGLLVGIYSPTQAQRKKEDSSSCVPQAKVSRKQLPPQESSLIKGTVLDPNAAVIVGADVGITNKSTKRSSVTKTDDEGRFHFPSLVAGTYLIMVRYPGFNTYKNKKLVLAENQLLEIDVTMFLHTQPTTTVGLLMYPEGEASSSTVRRNTEKIRRLPINN